MLRFLLYKLQEPAVSRVISKTSDLPPAAVAVDSTTPFPSHSNSSSSSSMKVRRDTELDGQSFNPLTRAPNLM